MAIDDQYKDEIEKFQYFIFEMDDVLDEFVGSAVRSGYKLDYSLLSLDHLESYIDNFGGETKDSKHINCCSRYLGEVFRKQIGGHWDLCLDDPKNIYFKLPVITGFSSLDFEFCPIAIINNYIARSERGALQEIVRSNAEFATNHSSSINKRERV